MTFPADFGLRPSLLETFVGTNLLEVSIGRDFGVKEPSHSETVLAEKVLVGKTGNIVSVLF